MRIRTKIKGTLTTVKALIRHPMETGFRPPDKSGNYRFEPAHFIQDVLCTHNGNTVFKADWGCAVSKNPYLSFSLIHARKGDTINISWYDNRGKTDSKSVVI